MPSKVADLSFEIASKQSVGSVGQVHVAVPGLALARPRPGGGRVGGHRRCGGRIWRGPDPRPAARAAMPAAFKQALADSRWPPVACSTRRRGHPRPPRANTCRWLVSLKTLLMGRRNSHSPADRQRLSRFDPWWPVFRCRSVARIGCPQRLGVSNLKPPQLQPRVRRGQSRVGWGDQVSRRCGRHRRDETPCARASTRYRLPMS